jgi:hypothetical protein
VNIAEWRDEPGRIATRLDLIFPRLQREGLGKPSWRALVFDFALLVLIFAVVSHICHVPDFSFSYLVQQYLTGEGEVEESSEGFALLFAVLVTLLAYSQGGYRRPGLHLRDENLVLLRSVTVAAALMWPSAQLVWKSQHINGALGWTALSAAMLLTSRKWCARRVFRQKAKAVARNVIIVGVNETIGSASLTECVELLGHIPPQRLNEYYKSADLVVLTSRSEGIPLVLMEAMARGKLVLAPDITGIPELVRDWENGFLFRAGSLEDFVSRVDLINEAWPALSYVRRGARSTVARTFNREKNLKHFCDFLLDRLPAHARGNKHASAVLQ